MTNETKQNKNKQTYMLVSIDMNIFLRKINQKSVCTSIIKLMHYYYYY